MNKSDSLKTIGARSVLLFLMSLILILNYTQHTDAISNAKRVLFISSYTESYEGVPPQIQGIKEVLSPEGVNVDIEYMDTKRIQSTENLDLFYKVLKFKLNNVQPYDALIVGDDSALQFAIKYQSELFPKLPIIYLGINDVDYAVEAGKDPYITGVIEETSLKDNIELALKFNPDADRIIAIVDDSTTGIGDQEQFYANEDLFPQLKFDTLISSDFTFNQIADQLEAVKEDTILLYLSMYSDKTGAYLTVSEASRFISMHSHVPVYRASVGGVGKGILGGKMVNFEESGQIAAGMVLQIFHGTPVQDIEVITESPNYYILDYDLLQKFNISLDLVPEGTTLINQKISFYEQNKKLLWMVTSVISVLIIFTVVLIIDNLKRRTIEKALTESHESLTRTNEILAQKEEEFHYQAHHDYLTELPNRMSFTERLTDEINHERPFALIMLDIDNFKGINDTLGHVFGDFILKDIASRLNSIKTEDVFISRFGGDEFLILLSNEADLKHIEKFITQIQDAFKKPFSIGRNEHYIEFSMGVTRYPADSTNLHQLMMNADTAMYKVKHGGKNSYQFYYEAMQESVKERAGIEKILRQALKEDGFYLVYQPRVSIDTGDIAGFEALLRLKGHKIPADLFIKVAEETDLILEIGRKVTREAIAQIARWKEKGLPKKKVSINFSNKQIRDINYFQYLQDTLEEFGVDPDYLEIEITESILMDDTSYTTDFLYKLREIGINIAMDDFGTGYSSLIYLTYIPVDHVKLDKSLSDKFLQLDNISVMNSIISLAHSLNLKITAEGIEEQLQYERLKEAGCDYIQGYYFSKPLSIEDAENIYNKKLSEGR